MISKEAAVLKPMIYGDHTFRTTEVFDGMIGGNAIVMTGANVDLSGMIEGDLIIEQGATVKLSGMIGGQISNKGKLI
jgi:hypothetical protein